MLNQNALDLGRTHPHTTDLEHVVGPAIKPVVTIVVLVELVARRNPIALDRLLGFIVRVPVSCASCLALHPEIAYFACNCRLALVVQSFNFQAIDVTSVCS